MAFYQCIKQGSGGGGGGSSVGIQSTVIYEPTSASSAGSTYALSDSIDNYDFISIYNGVWNEYSGSGDKFAEDAFVPVHTFNSLYAEGKQYAITSYSSRYMHVVLHDTSATVTARSNLDICKIVGHKLIGGGSGGSGGLTKDVIYQNSGSSIPSTITLDHGISEYDMIVLSGYRSQYPTYWSSKTYLSDECVTNRNISLTDDAMYAWYTITNDTTLTLIGSANMVIDKIYGLKY